MTKTKKKELKARLFKILHGICYVLSAIFVLVLIVACVKGCGGKKTQRTPSQSIAPQQFAISNSLPYSYYEVEFNEDGLTIYDLEKQQLLVGGDYDLSSPSLSGADITIPLYSLSDNGGSVYVFEEGVQYQVSTITLYLDIFNYSDSDTTEYLRIYDLYCTYNSQTHYFLHKTGEYANDYYYEMGYFGKVYQVSSDLYELFDSGALSYIFSRYDKGEFTFNKEFNYNAPMGMSIDSPYGSGASWTSSTQYMAHLDYYVGDFYSNGQIFDTIQYWCTSAGDSDFEILTASGTTTITQGAQGSWAYIWLYYVNSKTNVSVIVNYRNQVAYVKNSTTNAYYYQNSSTWQNDQYRYVTFLVPLDDAMQTKIMAFNNNNQYSGGSIYSGGGNIFTLIGSAFTGILPILSIMILPNITLGMLLFVPLVAILVFAIVKIVKK